MRSRRTNTRPGRLAAVLSLAILTGCGAYNTVGTRLEPSGGSGFAGTDGAIAVVGVLVFLLLPFIVFATWGGPFGNR